MFEREERQLKKSSDPHPCAQKNMETAFSYLKEIEPLGSLSIVYQDCDPITNVIKEPKFVAFYWKEGLRDFGHPVSFHQNSNEFSDELKKCISFLLYKRLARKTTSPKRVKDLF